MSILDFLYVCFSDSWDFWIFRRFNFFPSYKLNVRHQTSCTLHKELLCNKSRRYIFDVVGGSESFKSMPSLPDYFYKFWLANSSDGRLQISPLSPFSPFFLWSVTTENCNKFCKKVIEQIPSDPLDRLTPHTLSLPTVW